MAAQPQLSEDQPSKVISFSIWPPTQRTRDVVISRLIETLSTSSVPSKRYGTMSHEDASAVARRIENESFSTAADSASTDHDGIEIIQRYSKEISKLMLDTIKSRAATPCATDNDATQAPSSVVSPPAKTEGASPLSLSLDP